MNVVYLFLESGKIRLPFSGYNKPLFNSMVRSGGGWDAESRVFVFERNVSTDHFRRLVPGAPLVKVEEGSPCPPEVLGFMECPLVPEHPLQPSVKGSYQVAPNVDVKPSVFSFPPACAGSCAACPPSLPPDNNTAAVYFDGASTTGPVQPTPAPFSPFSFPAPHSLPDKFSAHWRDLLEAELRSRKYSPQTRRAYIYYNRLICRSLQKTPEEIRPADVTQFLALMEKDREYSASALNIAISAIKFFFRHIMKNEDISERRRPHQDGRLPVVLSKEEISRILGMEKNPKHRLLLMLVYSSGLRVSEVVSLKKEHIDLSRKVIYIKLGKGRKDRITLLSEKAAHFLEEYYEFFGIEKWLFPGQPPTRPLSIRSAQLIFDKTVRRAGISKKVSIHGLRHTFATHLLESGTDIRYIQSLLGHSSLRTTERYTHVARRSVLNIKSPLDSIP